jgi:hypothetical protein
LPCRKRKNNELAPEEEEKKEQHKSHSIKRIVVESIPFAD